MTKKTALVFVFLAAIVLGFLCELAPWQRQSITKNNHPFIPIICGGGLLLVAFSKLPVAKQLKPTLLILAISGLVFGVLEYMLNDQGFRGYAGNRTAVCLYRFKFIFAGIGVGAALTSLFYGHWTSALLAASQRQHLNATQKKND